MPNRVFVKPEMEAEFHDFGGLKMATNMDSREELQVGKVTMVGPVFAEFQFIRPADGFGRLAWYLVWDYLVGKRLRKAAKVNVGDRVWFTRADAVKVVLDGEEHRSLHWKDIQCVQPA